MIVYDPRARYLTGLLGWPSYDPRARYLTGVSKKTPPVRRRRGLGDDSGLVQIPLIPYVPSIQVVNAPDGSRWLQTTDAQGNMTSTPLDNGVQPSSTPTPATIVVTPNSGAIPPPTSRPTVQTNTGVTSFLNQQSIKGVPNGALMLGLGAVGLLLAGGSGGRRR